MFLRADVKAVGPNVFQPAHIQGEAKPMAPFTIARISDALIAERLITKKDVKTIVAELNEIAADCETVMSLPRTFQVWGTRAI